MMEMVDDANGSMLEMVDDGYWFNVANGIDDGYWFDDGMRVIGMRSMME